MWDVGQSVPQIYAALDNRQGDHKVSIINVDGKIGDQFVSIFIDPRSNYNYVNPDLVDKYGLNK